MWPRSPAKCSLLAIAVLGRIYGKEDRMDLQKLTGSIVALVTPFNEDGSIDYASLDKILEFQVTNGTDGILVLGTSGESATMTDAEDIAVAKFAVEHVGGAVPIFGGAGSNCTRESYNKSLELEKVGVDGLLVITPYYNKSNKEGIYQHFKTVLDAIDVPAILYNVPSRTGCSISVKNLERLSKHPRALAIKEASGSIGYATEIAHCLGPDFGMFSGNDDMVLPLMSLGARGVISVWANVMPKEVHEMCKNYLAGNIEEARKTQLACLDLIHALFCEVNPIPVKQAMADMGLLQANYRLPLWPMTDEDHARLRRAMEGVGLLG